MRPLIGLLALASLALEPLPTPVDVPPDSTGRIIVRGDEQVATRRVEGRFEIVIRQRRANAWSEPRVLFTAPSGTIAFASALSPDGRRLLFESNARTPPVAGREDSDLWMIDREAGVWGQARPIGAPWATTANEHAASMAIDGTVCLNSARPGGAGENDIYCAPSLNAAPMPMAALNSPGEDAFASIAADGDTIVFASNRDGGLGKWDLYAARRVNGAWQVPVNLGAPINSSNDELHPWLDGDTLYFVRTGATPRTVLAVQNWQVAETRR